MKVFWALMALIAVAAVVMLTTDLGGGKKAEPAPPIRDMPNSAKPDSKIEDSRRTFREPVELDESKKEVPQGQIPAAPEPEAKSQPQLERKPASVVETK